MKIENNDNYDMVSEIYIAGAKEALNHRGYDDFMVYYTLLSMGVPKDSIQDIGKEERDKRVNKMEIKNN